MTNINPFIKKYKSAIASKSSEMRISIEEATAIVTAFAELETSNKDIEEKLDKIYNAIKSLNDVVPSNDGVDGGFF